MRRLLILILAFGIATAGLAALWIFRGRDISSFIDRYWTVETKSGPIHSIIYEGNGTGGMLVCDGISFSLNDTAPGLSLTIGSTKNNELALASSGKVFSFGPLRSGSDDWTERLATTPPAGDQALVAVRHSFFCWPTLFEVSPTTGQSPSWERNLYYEILWTKASGAHLRMLWRYEQFFYPGNGWAGGLMTRQGSTGLIGIEITQ
jgi:hypothetical protein